MFKNIKIGTKITILVLVVILISLSGIIFVADQISQKSLSASEIRFRFTFVGSMILLIALVASVVFSRILTRPLITLKTTMRLLGEGVLPEKIKKSSEDELGEMTETVNKLVEGLHKTVDFAHKIEEGEFEAEFKPMSKDDMLGVALLSMRDSIQESAKRDEERNWIVVGVAEIGSILRSTNHLEELSDKVVAYLTNKIGAVQGALYVVNDDDDSGKWLLEMKASYAYNKKKYLKAQFRFAEGLVGQAAAERDTILRTEIPDSYVTVTSGLLGDRKPKCLLVVPLMTVIGSEKVVYGALEFAGFERFTARNVQYVNEVSEIIARTVFNIKVNEKTQRLLQMSQRQSQELQAQQEILQQNAEEMQATQEELKRANTELEYQIEQVVHAQKRLQTLLENASEVIMIYEKDRTIRYVSPSVNRILGYSQEELIGIDNSSHVHETGKEALSRMFTDLMAYPDQRQTVQFSYYKKNGEQIWLEATGTNLLADPAISGILVNATDITERLRAEREQRMRSQMQSLSENSPDLIIRFDKSGRIFYINPMIEVYAGQRKELFSQKSLDELTVDPIIVEAWRSILGQVMEGAEKVSTEMDFPSTVGNRIMHVNAIPEFGEENTVESVLFVLHDITERKMTELEISTKNKKISESINYAKRIQGAILPDNDLITTFFPKAFILYKPRDVVSGDFPWFMHKGDELYIAAVDCTGHGVPGALISLIGYFLLNNITENGEDLPPGEILDRLDRSVTATLRQDASDESSTRDGMDIALCKINLKTNTLQYSGAHRPLYFVHDNALTEVKGDKFPIGGGQYKGRTNFVTTTINLSQGDSVFFFSDGFPDQFGGDDNRKFSPKRIRDIITANLNQTMPEIHHTFDVEFEKWRGDTKQTDDVLMIGIRF